MRTTMRVVAFSIVACFLQQALMLPTLAIRVHQQAKPKRAQGEIMSSSFFANPIEKSFSTSKIHEEENVKEDIPKTSSDRDDMSTWWGVIADAYPPPFLGPAIAVNPYSIGHEGSSSLDIENGLDSDLLEGIDESGDSQAIPNAFGHDKHMEP
ncbi:hypothetical protein GOP47_0000806 [Adiantum capillus-veneris]|uniref:Uncharacterized protein n=2 Tax=Adiantum capillus-veneris TaxID=13818 RepID=A0A9D4ZT99_ADICA|nr:hypothetical protein GOP47_0000806 [Adiantum capillus-veneris]